MKVASLVGFKSKAKDGASPRIAWKIFNRAERVIQSEAEKVIVARVDHLRRRDTRINWGFTIPRGKAGGRVPAAARTPQWWKGAK